MKAERKYLAHFLDAAFDKTYAASEYVRIGKDLEELSEELNPDVEVRKNILGENRTFVGRRDAFCRRLEHRGAV